MPTITLPVRFTDDEGIGHQWHPLELATERAAFLLVDCDGDCGPACNSVIQDRLAPALQVARSVGIRGIFTYNDGWMPDGPASRPAELHHTRRGLPPHREPWRPTQPTWDAAIAPVVGEPIIGKKLQNAFVGTYLDSYLRAHDIDTLLLAGFSFKSCLFYTTVGAFEHNYRVVFLRDGTDPVGANEFPDTLDRDMPEGGWVRRVLTRLIEDHLGYTSTCTDLIQSVHLVHGVADA